MREENSLFTCLLAVGLAGRSDLSGRNSIVGLVFAAILRGSTLVLGPEIERQHILEGAQAGLTGPATPLTHRFCPDNIEATLPQRSPDGYNSHCR